MGEACSKLSGGVEGKVPGGAMGLLAASGFADKLPPFAKGMLPSEEKPSAKHSGDPTTRWEKACTTMNATAKSVGKYDDDGIDVYCFPGAGSPVDKFLNVKSLDSIAQIIGGKAPGGDSNMGAALEAAIDDAFEAGFDKPCTILVMTAGLPSDKDDVVANIVSKAAKLENAEHLSITFVQVGDSKKATDFLKSLDEGLGTVDANGTEIDIVDTIKDEEIQAAVGEMKEPGFMASGGGGALFGAFGGMVMGAGAAYAYNKYQAGKRTEGWNGEWEVFKGGETTEVKLTVVDDKEGNITIEGWPEDDSAGLVSAAGTYEQDDETFTIARKSDTRNRWVNGTVVDEHEIEWSDGTVWKEVAPEGVSWGSLAAAGAGGAAVGGAAGYLTQKKFFSKSTNGEPANYKLVLDCSDAMLEEDQ